LAGESITACIGETMKDAKERSSYPALVLLMDEEGIGAPLRALTTLLAQSIAADFGDAVAVIALDGDGAEAGASRHGVEHHALRAPAEVEGAVASLREALTSPEGRAAYVFLDVSRRSRAFQIDLARRLGDVDLGGLAGRIVHLTRSRTAPSFPGWSMLRTHLLAPLPDAQRAEGMRQSASATRDLLAKEMGRLTGATPEDRGESYPSARITPDFCRIRIDLDAVGRLAQPSLTGLAAPLRASLSRWARAVTDRRIGVALGGSGSWGYAHVALIEALEHARVPIDLIGSASSGSLMGAYYVVLGRPGLELAVRRGREFQRMALASVVTSAAIEHRLDIDLGRIAVEDLEILFFPVATNLTNAAPELITRSTVGFGVRASGSAPGFFAPTIAKDALYVDGAVTDNVPALMLERMGAALVIAANALPPPNGVRVPMPRTRSRALVDELSLRRRAKDLIASLSLMFHDSGDVPTSGTRVLFDPPGERLALFRTFEFDKAERILAHVKQEREFADAVSKSVAAWDELRSPRKAGVA
jgi:NTE family protein